MTVAPAAAGRDRTHYLGDGCDHGELATLRTQSYLEPRLLPGRRWTAVLRLNFTWAVVVGHLDDPDGYTDRWCYETALAAFAALKAWDGEGEPVGWHRHPRSGRRIARTAHEYDRHGRLVPIGEEYLRP